MAQITKRGDYQWLARIRRSGYPEQSQTFETKDRAEMWARDIESKMDRGVFVDRSALEKTKVADLLTRYGEEVTPGKKGATKELSKLKVLKNSFLGKMSVAKVEPGDIVDFRDYRIKHVGPATVTKEMNLLSNVFNVARTEWRMKGLENPVEGVRRPKAPKNRDRRLESWEEAERIIDATDSPTLKVLIPLAVETAMRRGEMKSIRRRDVNMEKQTLKLHDTKNNDSRVVPLSRRALALLRSLPYCAKDDLDGEIFGVKPDSMTQAFSRAVKRARARYEAECKEKMVKPDREYLTNLHLHDLRHEATSRLFEDKGLEMMEVMSITGHKDARQLRRYTHLRAERLAKKLN